MSNKIKIVYACNDKLFDGLYLSILSIVRRTKTPIDFYILSADLTDISPKYKCISANSLQKIGELLNHFNKESTVNFIDCKKLFEDWNKERREFKRNSPYALFRLFVDQIEGLSGKILYLDVDTFINGDIKEAFDVDLENIEACVCHDYLTPRRYDSNNKLYDYFNSGVMLINIDVIRTTLYFKKTLNFISKNKTKLVDQDALNLTRTNILFWPNEYRFNYQKPSIEKDTIIKHFLNLLRKKFWTNGIRQWHCWGVKHLLKLHNWDEDYAFFKNKKKEWRKRYG